VGGEEKRKEKGAANVKFYVARACKKKKDGRSGQQILGEEK